MVGWSRSTELVPTCHSTRSGASSSTSRIETRDHLRCFLAVMPLLSTVIGRPGRRSFSSASRRARIGSRRTTCPAPEVDDEPIGDDLERLACGDAFAQMRPADARGLSPRRAQIQPGLRSARDAGARARSNSSPPARTPRCSAPYPSPGYHQRLRCALNRRSWPCLQDVPQLPATIKSRKKPANTVMDLGRRCPEHPWSRPAESKVPSSPTGA